ncbi:MAG: DUF4145 domain-containing protein [Thiobacillus sp.]|nr:DUF4145 domain-containing protein [Thiobacillus sp.]
MNRKSNPPSVSETAFECPHCGAYTTQHWYKLAAEKMDGDRRNPGFPDAGMRQRIPQLDIDAEKRAELIQWIDNMDSGLAFLEKNSFRSSYTVNNLNISECFNCSKIAVWVHQSLIFPLQREGASPNADLPPDIAKDFEEARSILNSSPRGAAALLRLCVQKLCGALGEKGRNIDDDIASLVAKGLNPIVQKSLDVVRVVGNEAVHPGSIDLRDDRDTALQLLNLVNLIADQMITHPKAVHSMYEMLPEGKRAAIEQRNERALSQ